MYTLSPDKNRNTALRNVTAIASSGGSGVFIFFGGGSTGVATLSSGGGHTTNRAYFRAELPGM